ncbi:MAG: o-succinylbenzoate synthase [Ignavibacteriales bacterium]|nr:o-succinylbenzoate synthase [Ignavibacteriales bacterium]
MIIKDFKYFPFTLQLKAPFQTASQVITERSGFIISLSDENGNVSFGECSPISGFSLETLEDAERILKGLCHQMIGFSVEETLHAVSELLIEFKLVPSLQFALEQAIISLMIQHNKDFMKAFFINTKSEIDVNAVIGLGDIENIVAQVDEKIRKGFVTFKLKVGRDDAYEDFLLLKMIRNEFGYNINLRLDANRKWSADEAMEYLDRFQQFNISYVEEPCEHICSIFKLLEESPIPIALDESLVSFENAEKLINECKIEFIILKPMVLGGLISSLRLIKNAGKKNKKVIISSSFESAVGKSGLVLLAAITNHNFAHGLDTSDFFEKDICADSFKVENGKIIFTLDNYPPQFNLYLT